MQKVIVMLKGNHPCDLMFADLYGQENITVFPDFFEVKNPILKFLCRVHHSQRVAKTVRIPFRDVWSPFYSLKNYKFEKGTSYLLFFYNISIPSIEHLKYLNCLREEYNIKFALYLIDSMSTAQIQTKWSLIESYHFDYIYTFDKNDADKYGYGFNYTPCSKYRGDYPSSIDYKLYFCGWNKGRLSFLKSIAEKLEANKISFYFRITGVHSNTDSKADGLEFAKQISYWDNIKNTLKTNCILEVVQGQQYSSTLRYFEAVIYNKKLLTNNDYITKYPYYNEKFMRVFHVSEDIDLNWLEKIETIDYGYKGDFSPLCLIEKILNQGSDLENVR